jgi:tetratricopeptide (TPR) repeat protein
LGLLYLRTKELDDAEPLFRQALEIYRQKAGEAHPTFADSLEKLGQLYTANGDYLIAEQFLLRAAATYNKTLPKTHPLVLVAQGLESYAAMLRKAEPNAEAAHVERRANEIRDAVRQAELKSSANERPNSTR